MSDTPRTDCAQLVFANWKAGIVQPVPEQPNGWEFSRQLERENYALREQLEAKDKDLMCAEDAYVALRRAFGERK